MSGTSGLTSRTERRCWTTVMTWTNDESNEAGLNFSRNRPSAYAGANFLDADAPLCFHLSRPSHTLHTHVHIQSHHPCHTYILYIQTVTFTMTLDLVLYSIMYGLALSFVAAAAAAAWLRCCPAGSMGPRTLPGPGLQVQPLLG
jgi:hypothetical protein